MKGPGLRIDNDVRRTWQCPACGRTSRAEGEVVALRCNCKPDGTVMRLVEGRRQVRQFPRPAPEPRPANESEPAENLDPSATLATATEAPVNEPAAAEPSISEPAAINTVIERVVAVETISIPLPITQDKVADDWAEGIEPAAPAEPTASAESTAPPHPPAESAAPPDPTPGEASKL